MVREYVRVRPDWTTEQALDYLRQISDERATGLLFDCQGNSLLRRVSTR